MDGERHLQPLDFGSRLGQLRLQSFQRDCFSAETGSCTRDREIGRQHHAAIPITYDTFCIGVARSLINQEPCNRGEDRNGNSAAQAYVPSQQPDGQKIEREEVGLITGRKIPLRPRRLTTPGPSTRG